jgi:hypothetical protein
MENCAGPPSPWHISSEKQDDGTWLISVQWRREDGRGVVILFAAGSDDADFCWSEPGHNYAMRSIEFKLNAGLPGEAKEIWQRIFETTDAKPRAIAPPVDNALDEIKGRELEARSERPGGYLTTGRPVPWGWVASGGIGGRK